MSKKKIGKTNTEGLERFDNGGEATRQDSLNLLNNSNAVLKYYSGKQYKNIGDRPLAPSTQLFNSIEEDRKFFIKRGNVKYPTSDTDTNSGKLDLKYYYKKVDDNRFYQRESYDFILDTRSPMQLFDKRITPNREIRIANTKIGDSMEGDKVKVYTYSPLSVTPWDMLTPDQKKQRIDTYGVSGSPFKTEAEYQNSTRPPRRQVSYRPTTRPRPTTPSVTAPIIKAVDKIKSVVERPISKAPRQIVYGERPPAPIVEDKTTGGYMDSRGVMMDKPQTAGNYTPEQLVKMGYRAKQSNVTLPNSKMKYGKGGGVNKSDYVDLGLDAASFIPGPVGMTASTIGAMKNLYEGDYVGAGIDALNVITMGGSKWLGEAAKLAKYANKTRLASSLANKAQFLKSVSDPVIPKTISLIRDYKGSGNNLHNLDIPNNQMSVRDNTKVKMAKGGLIKGIGGALYGAAEGGLDAMSMGLTDQITDAGANAIGGKDKTFNASRAGGNIAGAVGMDALTMGATHAGTVQQVAKGTNGLVQNTNIFGDKEKQGIGMGLQSFQALVPFLGAIEGGIQKQEQGGMNNTTINVEGSGIQSGQKASMKKGELLTSNGMVLRNFINIPPHPTDPNLINPDGTVQVPEGTTVIPKNRTKEYMERDLKGKQQLEKSLISAQRLRERKEAKMAKGGAVERYDTKALVPGWGGMGSTRGGFNINNPAFDSGASIGAGAPGGGSPTGIFSDMDPAMSAMNILPIAWKFGKGIFGKADHSNPEDYMVNARMKWNDLSNDQVQRKVNEGYNLGRYNMRNSGNYNLAGDVALGTNLMKTKAEEQEKIMYINAEGKFKADASNIDLMRSNMATKLTVDDMNAKNKAMKTDYINSGFEDIGKIGAFGLQKDYINNYMKKAYPRGYAKKGGKVK